MLQAPGHEASYINDLHEQQRMHAVATAVGNVLIANELPCRIWSGMQAAVIGEHRYSSDIDVWVPDDTVEKTYDVLRDQLDMPVTLDDHYDDRVMIGVGPKRELEIMSRMDIKTDDGTFPMRLTRSVLNLGPSRRYDGWNMLFAPPEDTIILKAILARREDVGKYDHKDIAVLRDNCLLDQHYLMRRIAETGSAARVLPLLERMGVATYSAREKTMSMFGCSGHQSVWARKSTSAAGRLHSL